MHNQDHSYKNIALLQQSLEPLGYTFRDFNFGSERFMQFKHPTGKAWISNTERIYYPFVSTGAKPLLKDKNYSNEFAKMFGINIPKTITVDEARIESAEVKQLLSEVESVIVKPLDSTLSKGLTTDINRLEDVKAAAKHALKYSSEALVQEQVYGDDIRFFVLKSKVVGVILRQTPRITGDGVHTVSELIKHENQVRKSIELPFEQHYRQLDESHIDLAYLESQQVLADGEVLELSRQVLVRRGASVINITDTIHPSYISKIEMLANNLGRGLVAVDMMVRDYKKEIAENNYWFLEFNSSPLLALMYCVRDGNHIDILPPLTQAIDEAIANS